MSILVEEGLAYLPEVSARRVRTPCGVYDGLVLPSAQSLAAVSIMRSGDCLLEAVRRTVPGVAVGKVLIQRDESAPGKEPRLIYVKLPADIAEKRVLLVDPMLATGQSAEMAIQELKRRGIKEAQITFINVVCCPEGLAYLAKKHPEVLVITAAIDDRLNEALYIVPGLGDMGDRYYDTPGHTHT